MASTLSCVAAFATLPSNAQIPNSLLFSQAPRLNCSFFCNRSFNSCTSAIFYRSPVFSPSHHYSPRRNLPAANAEYAPPSEEILPPETVEAQIEIAAATSTGKGEEVFAVVMIGSRQYIVIPGRFIYTQRLKGANVNDKVILNKVLLVGTKTKAYIGQPIVTNAVVHAVVEEQGLDKKVIVFKFKKKKNYRRTIGHRQPNTRIRIIGISGFEDYPADTMPEPEAVAA